MKRYFYLIAAIAGLFMAASCQKENFEVADGDYAEVSFTADLPGVATKAIADGQTVNKLYYEVYAASDAEGTVATDAQAVVDGTAEISAGKATVNVRLVKNKKYTVFFWAQYEETGYTSPYRCTDLRNITVSYANAVANDERRDAFYAVEKAVSFSSAATEKVTLTRPFAQVNVGTSDLDILDRDNVSLDNAESTLTVTNVANTFNPFDNTATYTPVVELTATSSSQELTATFAAASIPDGNIANVGDGSTTYKYLATAYVLVPGNGKSTSVSTISSTITTSAGDVNISYEGANVQQNRRTNLVGKFLTSSVDYDVIVDSNFYGEDHAVILSPAELADKLNSNTSPDDVVYNITASADVAIEIPSGFVAKNVKFNFAEFKTDASLTITGADFEKNVTIILPANVDINNLTVDLPKAHVVLEQGNITTVISSTSSSTLEVGDGVKVESITVNAGNVEIQEGGEVEVIAVGPENNETVKVILGDTVEMPTVTGGEVTKVVDNNEETVQPAGDFLYIKDGKWTGSVTFLEAINNADPASTISMGDDVTSSDIIVIGKSLTLNGNGYSLTSTAERAINVSGANVDVTIKNLTISASGERAINVIQNAKKVTVENVTATAKKYTVNVASSTSDAEIVINNSTLTGLNVVNVSSADTEVTLTGCTVNCNDNNTTPGEDYAALCLNKEASNAVITAIDCTINVTEGSDSVKGRNGAEGGEVTINGSNDNVDIIVAALIIPGQTEYYDFTTFAEAIEFAKDGYEITLIRDAESTGLVKTSKNLTLDLNKKTLTVNSDDKEALYFEGNLTIKNGTIKTSHGFPFVASANPNSDKGSKVTITDMKIEATRTQNDGAVFLLGWADVTFNNVEINATGYGTAIEGSCEDDNKTAVVNIDNTDIKIVRTSNTETTLVNSGTALGSGYGSTINFNSGKIDASNYAAYAFPTGGLINIKGGTIIGDFCEHTPDAEKSTEIVITGGSYSENPTDYLDNGYTATLSEGYYVVSQTTPKE